MRRWIIVAIAVFAVAGCGDRDPAIPFAELRADATRARCEHAVRCGVFADHDTCTSFFRVPDDSSLAAAIDAGRIRYDGEAALRCHEAIAASSCDVTTRDARLPESCDQIFQGRVEADSECAFDLECESNACLLPGCPPGECCPGACLPGERGALGAACQSDTECAADTFCGSDRRCRALAAVGEPCRNDTQCEFGLGCVGKTALIDGACRPLPSIGERCADDRCAELGAVCNGALSCVAVGLPGAPCAGDLDCSLYAQCGPSNTCIDVPQLGMPCTVRCAGDAQCSNGVCSPPLEDGAFCILNEECASQFCWEGPLFSQCQTRAVCF